MISTIRAAVAITFINTAFIILFISASSVFKSQAISPSALTLGVSNSTSPHPVSPSLVPASPPSLSVTKTASPVNPTPASPATVPTPDTRCLIQVRGQVFDITQFRSLHSGGDIFQCGTDMTAVFNSQHNDSTFEKLQKYKI